MIPVSGYENHGDPKSQDLGLWDPFQMGVFYGL